MGGFSVEMVVALLPSPLLRRWVVDVLRPRGSKWLFVDQLACLWIGVGFGVLAGWVSAYRRGGFRFWDARFSGCCGFVL